LRHCARHQVDEVKKLATLFSAGGSFFALQNTDQTNVLYTIAGHRQGLHEARQSITRDTNGDADSFGFRAFAQ